MNDEQIADVIQRAIDEVAQKFSPTSTLSLFTYSQRMAVARAALAVAKPIIAQEAREELLGMTKAMKEQPGPASKTYEQFCHENGQRTQSEVEVELASVRALLDKAEEALEPFADEAKHFDPEVRRITMDAELVIVEVRARLALAFWRNG